MTISVTLGKYTTFKLLKFEIQYFHNGNAERQMLYTLDGLMKK